jgi:hypothetical protein
MSKMRLRVVFAVLGLFVLFAPLANAQSGFFRVEQREGVWWLIDPDGSPTLSMGVDHISYEADRIRGTGPCPYAEALDKIYPDRNAWALMTLARLRLWGFNTVAAWSDPELGEYKVPYTIILDIAQHAGANWQHGEPVDVYAPRFEQGAREIAESMCKPRAQDRYLLGYFTDNELRWGPDWRGKETMLEMYLKLGEGAPGREQALEFLRGKYQNDVSKLNQAWGTNVADLAAAMHGTTDAYRDDADAFLEQVATRYFEVCDKAIKSADPNHLDLGARFAGGVPDAVMRSARGLDVVSVNIYDFDPRLMAKRVIELAGRPIMVTEFAFRATDSGLPNTRGAGPRVPSQEARAKAFADYVERLLSLPEAVGYHWFEWVDEPKEGRFDGEDSNYGLVNINDEPYEEFVKVAKDVNGRAIEMHKKSAPSPAH